MISILRAKVEDAAELLKVKIRSFEEDVDLYGSGPPGYDSMDKQINAIENGFYYKIADEERIIGGMCIYDRGGGYYWLGSVYIDKDQQNKGIGSKAMSFLEEEFPQAIKWGLETPYLSYRNHHFYEKMGFTKVGETEPESNGFYLYLYEKLCAK